MTSLRLLRGEATDSPLITEVTNYPLQHTSSSDKVCKVELASPFELHPNEDYTIRLTLSGEAGVFRGGSTTRTRNGPNEVVFKFKGTIYHGDDVKNGENADDGPIFDIYYKMGLEQDIEEI